MLPFADNYADAGLNEQDTPGTPFRHEKRDWVDRCPRREAQRAPRGPLRRPDCQLIERQNSEWPQQRWNKKITPRAVLRREKGPVNE